MRAGSLIIGFYRGSCPAWEGAERGHVPDGRFGPLNQKTRHADDDMSIIQAVEEM